jgi:acetyl-CoA C-acetyltransferase
MAATSAPVAADDGLPTLDARALDPRTPVIVGIARTPMGSFLGALAPLSAPELGGAAIAAALARANGGGSSGDDTTRPPRLSPSDVDEVLMGCVCSANLGQAPASQAARLGGLPDAVPATLVNKVCASGLKAVALAAQAVLAGGGRGGAGAGAGGGGVECVVAGGMESMSRVPHYAPGLRAGRLRLGHSSPGGGGGGGGGGGESALAPPSPLDGGGGGVPPAPPPLVLVDGLLRDGLECAESHRHMGSCAELAAAEYGVTRAAQDAAALATFARARAAEASGAVRREIVAVAVPAVGGGGGERKKKDRRRDAAAAAAGGGGSGSGGEAAAGPSSPSSSSSSAAVVLVDRDEPLGRLDAAKLRALKPYFRHDGAGTVTAGNASPLTDGAAAVVVVSARLAAERGLPVLAAVRGWADANGPAEWFSTAPSKAAPLALERAGGLTPADVDFWEINEAFMVVDLVNRRLLGLEAQAKEEEEEEEEEGGGRETAPRAPHLPPCAPPPPPRVNAHGGAVAIGHAIGASGAVLVARLVNVLRTEGGRIGCAVICNGGGGASAIVLECAGGGAGGGARAAPGAGAQERGGGGSAAAAAAP